MTSIFMILSNYLNNKNIHPFLFTIDFVCISNKTLCEGDNCNERRYLKLKYFF